MLASGLLGLLLAAPSATSLPTASPPQVLEPSASGPRQPRLCEGAYADSFDALSAEAREFERKQAPYTFCVRTSAVYECPVYSADGTLQHTRKKVTAHGTAFAYRQQSGETLLLTNDHVAEWPAVTDELHPVDDVPVGCRRVSDRLRIVDNDQDDYERDDVPLSRVVTDPALDMAVLKAHQLLPVMPWKVGKSAALHERNVVDVRGFPLGAFKATNVGKVISAYDHDDYRSWEHDDFVVDALLSPGNSGSPVLAISCRTGEFELVGVYHAGYNGGSALNLVVGVDQIRGFMTDLKRTPRPHPEIVGLLDGRSRGTLDAWLQASPEFFYSMGNLPVLLRRRDDGALLYEVHAADFPARAFPILVIEDLSPAPPESGFGRMGRVWFGSAAGLVERPRSALEADAQAQVARLLDVLRRDGVLARDYQALSSERDSSREHFERAERMARTLKRISSSRQELAQGVEELAERLSPSDGDVPVPLQAVLTAPTPAPATSGPAAPPGPPLQAKAVPTKN